MIISKSGNLKLSFYHLREYALRIIILLSASAGAQVKKISIYTDRRKIEKEKKKRSQLCTEMENVLGNLLVGTIGT